LAYFVVPRLAGESLPERLARGPLARGEGGRLAADLLLALQRAHDVGLTGGELDPDSLTCVDGRWVLTGLGIPRSPASRHSAPEERDGAPPTREGDLFVASQVLREALAPRASRGQRAVLERGGAAPGRRWSDAASFRLAMQAAAGPAPWRRRAAVLAAAVLALGAAGRAWRGPDAG